MDEVTNVGKERIVNFDNNLFCDFVEEHCPTLAADVKASFGIVHDDKPATKPSRATIYAVIIKTRYEKSIYPIIILNFNFDFLRTNSHPRFVIL